MKWIWNRAKLKQLLSQTNIEATLPDETKYAIKPLFECKSWHEINKNIEEVKHSKQKKKAMKGKSGCATADRTCAELKLSHDTLRTAKGSLASIQGIHTARILLYWSAQCIRASDQARGRTGWERRSQGDNTGGLSTLTNGTERKVRLLGN